jgi:hypothetical protein
MAGDPRAQIPSIPVITQLFGFSCDSTLTQCPDGSFPEGFLESADGNFLWHRRCG